MPDDQQTCCDRVGFSESRSFFPGIWVFLVRHWRRLTVSVLLFVLGAVQMVQPAWAIDPHRTLTQCLLRKWQFPQGLPQPRVLAITQTLDGHLWLGTQAGLFQFDGMRFTPAFTSCGCPLGNLWVQALAEDPEQQLWIATMGAGLIRLSDGQCERFGVEEGLPSLNVQCLLVDHHGTLWIGTDQGLARLLKGRITSFLPQRELTVQNVRALCETRTGTVFIGGDQAQLNLWRDGQFLTRKLSTIEPDAVIRALVFTPDGSLMVGTTSGLVRLDANGESKIGREDGLADDFIETVTCSTTGQIWVGTRDGLSRIGDYEIETIRTRDGLSQSTVCAICEDHEKNMWVGTKNGLNQFVDRRTIPLTTSEGLPSNETGAIVQDQSGTAWIGTLNAGLARFAGRRCELVATTDSGLPANRITTLAAGDPDELWVGTDLGLCQLRHGKVERRFTTVDGLPDNNILSLFKDRAGTLWIGTPQGLARQQGDRISRFASESELSRWPVRSILTDRKKELIVATDGGGLFRCREETAQHWLPQIPELKSVTAFIHGSVEQRYWAATRGDGLLLVQNEKVTRFTVQQGLYDDEIFGLIADGQGRLWMACSRGIFFVKQQELLDLAAGQRESVNSTQFSPLESLRTIECQQGVQPSVWRMNDGKIWFSTIHGIIIIDPAAIHRQLPPPPVSLEQMLVNGQIVDLKQKLHLPAGLTNLMFRYTALSFASPTRIEFRYQLEGFDKGWIDAGTRREAYYTNLPPGHYRFLVGASNPENEWSTISHPIEFTVKPYFYKTIWFYGLVCVVLALAIWGFLRLRVWQVRSRMNAALAERMRIARDLHDTLIQGFSGVTMQMQALATQLKSPAEKATLQDVIDDAGRCLREARQTVSGLRHAPGSAISLVDAISRTARQLTETDDVHLQLRMPTAVSPLPSEIDYNLLRIAQEAITNVVKHAGASTVTVTLSSTGNQLCLTIADDGCGFACDESYQPLGHYGLIGMRERAHQIQAELNIDSRLGRGTTVEILVPRTPVNSTMSTFSATVMPLMQDTVL